MESPKTRKTHKPPDNVKMSPLMKWLTPAKKKVEGTKETESANEINPTNPLRIIEIINTPTPNENSKINKSGDCGTKNTEKAITKFGVDALRDGYSEKLQGKVKENIQKITGDETKEAEKYKVLEGFEKGIGALDNVEEIGCFYKEKRVRVEKNECCVEESGSNAVENVRKKRHFECIDESRVTENNKNKKNLLNQENIVEFNNNISSEKRGQESVSENIPLLKTGKRLKNIKTVLVEESSSGNVRGKSKRRSKTSNNYDEKITSWLIPSPKAIATKENKQLRASKREITEKQSRVTDRKMFKKPGGVVKMENIKKTGNENEKDSTAEKDGSSTRKEGDDRGRNDELQRKMIEFFGGVIVLKKKEKSGSKDFPSTLKRNFPSSSKRNYSSKSTQRDAPSKPTFSSSGEKKIDKRQAEKTQAGKGREATDVKSSGEENSRKLGRQCEEKKRRKVAKEDGKLLKVKSEKELVLRENSFNKRRVKEKRNSLGKLGMKEEKRERSEEKNNSSDKSKTNGEKKSSEKREKKIFIFDKTKGGKPNSEKGEMKKKFKSSSEEPINQNNISHEKRKSSTAEEEAYGKKQKTTDRKKTTRRSKKFIGTKSPLDNFIKEGIKAKVDERENKRYSYEKYGIHLPSFSEIKKLKEQLETYSDKVNRAVDYVTNTSVTKEPKRLETEPEDVEVLGCEMLTCAEVEQYFEHLLPYLAAVVRGTEYNWRHEEFVKNLNACGNTENLAYSTSTGAFTPSQKDQLVEMCSGHFDKYPIEKKTKYYFDVLLPELCLRIFMDVHGMSREDAVDYLARRPVDDVA